tara:strand:+ start:10780 stop:11121 length:342 start_codon:yes stop_codon:yes gene_type:complete
MNRRKFLKRLGLTVGAVAIAPVLLSTKPEPQTVVVKEDPRWYDPKELESHKGTDGIFAQIKNNPKEYKVYGDQHQIKEWDKLILDYNHIPPDWAKTYKPLFKKTQIVKEYWEV